MAGSPPVAERLNLPTFHFVNRQVMSLIPGARRAMFATSCLSPRHVRRAALLLFLAAMALIIVALGIRARGEGFEALDFRRSALGIPEAGVRHPRGLGVRRRREAPAQAAR